MKYLFSLLVGTVLFSSSASAQTHVLEREEPVALKARQLEKFELTMGTPLDLVIEQANEVLPVAVVSRNVYDFYGNVTIARGSRLVGHYVGFKSGRHLVDWDSLQMAGQAGSFRVQPPLLGTMPDGTTGYVDFKPGAAVGAVVRREFIVPQQD